MRRAAMAASAVGIVGAVGAALRAALLGLHLPSCTVTAPGPKEAPRDLEKGLWARDGGLGQREWLERGEGALEDQLLLQVSPAAFMSPGSYLQHVVSSPEVRRKETQVKRLRALLLSLLQPFSLGFKVSPQAVGCTRRCFPSSFPPSRLFQGFIHRFGSIFPALPFSQQVLLHVRR